MVAIKAHYDGEKIVVPKELRGGVPGEVLIIFDKPPSKDEENLIWQKAQEHAFAKVWDYDEDALYDTL